MKKMLKISICMPVFNGASVIKPTLKSILGQSYKNYEIVIVDDCSTDNTEKVIKSYRDKRIKYYKNNRNLGYSKNLEICRSKAKGEILFLMGQDDILGKNALLNTHNAFFLSDNIGAVTRPYFWFDKEVSRPVRAKKQLNPKKNEILRISDHPGKIISLFSTLDQLSGLAIKSKFIKVPFHKDVFPCHVYPFASIFKDYPVVFLKDYTVAVRIGSSQCRNPKTYKKNTSYIYDKSPLQSWVDLFNSVFSEKKYNSLRKYMIKKFVATNYVGLVQIKNYARFRYLLREILLLLKYRWENSYNPIFWFFAVGCIVVPPKILIPMVDWYKMRINSLSLKNIKFYY